MPEKCTFERVGGEWLMKKDCPDGFKCPRLPNTRALTPVYNPDKEQMLIDRMSEAAGESIEFGANDTLELDCEEDGNRLTVMGAQTITFLITGWSNEVPELELE